ncbi:hypothetical protein AUR67_17415 [Pseudoalteromonas sp. XI10]|uniref:hypothetical protein n=1 Tax=Pseudoalteromonas sp. XI10 TaxID=1766621 RepID=UPI00073363C4|nr:hypothetical protein [Pseudoalteromonas sp. XI10]KTG18933.1 hypothetical protein AUR67_17415 [Pseudoalteromonas sp. XI10]
MSDFKFYFPPLFGGERKGLNDGGIVQFSASKALARETTQNIGDNPDNSGKPVIATFEHVNIAASEFPGRDQLYRIFEQCLAHVKNGVANEKLFFENGLAILKQPEISFLKISDENTTGLVGSDNDDTQSFYKLIRLSGSSSAQANVGGTYGIGQRAPFAHSPLRTIFYSSMTPDGPVFIGKSILATFPDPEKNTENQNIGWWCKPNDDGSDWESCRDNSLIPKVFKRDKVGTDIWVSGFSEDSWETTIRHSILEHFFAAIQNKQLIVQLKKDNEIITKIDHENLAEHIAIAADEDRSVSPRTEHMRGLGSTVYYEKALTSPLNGTPFIKDLPVIGEVKLYVFVDSKNEAMPNRWATMRSPRIIVEHFGSNLLKGFAAVLICDNENGNQYLAQLEDATHEQWNEEQTRNWTSKQKSEARSVLKSITKFVRETLKEIRGTSLKEQEDIPFLGDYLPVDINEEEHDGANGSAETHFNTDTESGARVTKPFSEIVSSRPIKQPPPSAYYRENLTPKKKKKKKKKSLIPSPKPSHIPSNKKGPKSSFEGKKEGVSKVLTTRNIHFRSFKAKNGYRLILRSAVDIYGELSLDAVGEDNSYSIGVTSATDVSTGTSLNFSGSKIFGIKLKSNEKKVILVELEGPAEICLTIGDK